MRHAAFLALLLASRAVLAGEPMSLHAVRTGAPPVIDGRLDDPAWRAAPPDDRFTQLVPDEGKAATARTELRVLYDDRAVYVGLRLHDAEPGRIVARLTRRDREVESDTIAVAFDSRADGSTAYGFQLNAAGIQSDGLFYDDTGWNGDWDAVWDGATRIDGEGWSAEFAIPLSVLRFSAADPQAWGFQVRRYVSRKRETTFWAFFPSTSRGFVSRFGRLEGLAGLRPRRTLELRPFVATRVRVRSDSGTTFLGYPRKAYGEAQPDAGIDLKLGVTSELTLDATVNPDFGQVEADQVVLNLSRFETQFPEKRPFFLEGADVFQTPIQLFYSRRIGRPTVGAQPGDELVDARGRPVSVISAPASNRIYTAAKLTGKVAPSLSVGGLAALTGPERATVRGAGDAFHDQELAPVRGFAVLRARYSPGGASYLGVMGTAVNRLGGDLYLADANHDAFAQGVDGQFQSADGAWRLTGQAVLSERVGGTARATAWGTPCADPADPTCAPIARSDGTTLGPGDTGWGGRLALGREGEHVVFSAEAQAFSPRLYLNDLGFLAQFDRRGLSGHVGWRETRPRGVFRNYALFTGGDLATDSGGNLLQLGPGVHAEATFSNYWFASVNAGSSATGMWDPHETGDGARFERIPGLGGGAFVASDSRWRVAGSGGVFGFADYHGGAWGLNVEANLSLRLVPRLELDLGPAIGFSAGNVRFVSCADPTGAACTVETPDRHYELAALDSGFLSATLRGTYTFSPRLTLQAYGQLFLARGAYGGYRSVDTVGSRPFIERDDLAPSTFTGDGDGDGVKDDDFQSTSLNANLVLRWELLPGSTLIAVYTRAQEASYDLAGHAPRLRLSGLSSGPTEDVFLIKLVYFVG